MGIKIIRKNNARAFEEEVNKFVGKDVKIIDTHVSPNMAFVAVLEGEEFKPFVADAEVIYKDADVSEYEEKIKELQDKLADCNNAEDAAKKECEEAKQRLDTFIRENAKLSKDLEKNIAEVAKKDAAIEKLKEDLKKVKSAFKALE